MRIGIDFDNTIVCYDAAFAAAAREAGYLHEAPGGGKRALRDAVRASAGEAAWRRLQALVYGERMAGAAMFPGFGAFVAAARRSGAALAIVSHKTPYSNFVSGGPNLRYAALSWMRAQGFFDPAALAFDVADVYFETTRAEKLARIRDLGCTHFIDDLVEVFEEPGFPEGVGRILFAPDGAAAPSTIDVVARDWLDVRARLFAPERAVA